MNKFLLIIIIACDFCVVYANTSSNPTNVITWCRPVKQDIVWTSKENIDIRFYKDEWFVTESELSGNIKLGDKMLLTDSMKVVNYSKRASVEEHKEFPISYGLDNDSLYIRVPQTNNSKWFYVINQTQNVKLDRFENNGNYVAISREGLEGDAILRISPENHVTSLIIVDSIQTVEVKIDTIMKDSLQYVYRKIGEVQVGKRKLLVSPTPTPTLDSKWIYGIVGLIIGSVLCLVFFVIQNKKIGKYKKNGSRQRIPYSIIAWEQSCRPKKIAGIQKLSTIDQLPKDNLTIGLKCLVKGDFFQTVEFLIPQEWQEVEKPINEDGVLEVFNSFERLFKQKAEKGDVYGVDKGLSLIKYFRYSVFDSETEVLFLQQKCNELSAQKEKLQQDVESLGQYKLEVDAKMKAAKEKDKEEKEKMMKDTEEQVRSAKEEAEIKINKAEKQAEEVISKVKAKAVAQIADVEKERDQAKEKSKTIKDELTNQFNEKKLVIENVRDKALLDLNTATSELSNTNVKLKSTMSELETSNVKVLRLEKAQEKYSSKLVYVPFAESYSGKIQIIMDIANKINKSAVALLDLQLKDPYHIMKCIAKYNKALSLIDMDMFYTDVKMITQGQMVLKGTTLSTYNQEGDKEQLYNTMKLYFFDNYLAGYVNAIVVLNESLAGIDRMVEGLSAKDTLSFNQYRNEIEKVLNNLEITIESVKLFDKVGNKIDLRVTQIDAGFSTGDILEIENCIVYLTGAHRPDTKIYVKAQG